MASTAAETVIGAIVLAVAGGFLAYAATTADLRGGSGYQVLATFRKAEGVNVGGDVRIAGVKVGSVAAMALDPKTYRAQVTLAIDAAVRLPDDSAAKIAASSLLGDSYIAIDPGASEFMIEPGGELSITQDSISLTDLLGRMVQGSAGQ